MEFRLAVELRLAVEFRLAVELSLAVESIVEHWTATVDSIVEPRKGRWGMCRSGIV